MVGLALPCTTLCTVQDCRPVQDAQLCSVMGLEVADVG
jgi:hypothetical protein